jgi:hypothetical protein
MGPSCLGSPERMMFVLLSAIVLIAAPN